MKRRDFISFNQNDELQSADFNQYNNNMSAEETAHFLRRLCFESSYDLIKQFTGKKPSEAFDIIINADAQLALPTPTAGMNSWLNVLEEDPLSGLPNEIRQEIQGRHHSHYREFVNWWTSIMRNDLYSAREKMVHFLSTIWSIEFTYDTEALISPPLLYRNNQTLRNSWNKGYKAIAEAMVLDGAMLLYQSLFYSNKNQPNENFMRELMELFTMGIGDIVTGETNYTEGDIREGSKALTGWSTVTYIGQDNAPANKPYQTFFRKDDHDMTGKTLFQFGAISPISEEENTEDLVKEKEVKGLIDILFTQRGEQISRFIAEKLYRYYIYSNPGEIDASTIEQIAKHLRDNDFNLVTTLKMMLCSNMFFSQTIRACQIKNPTEFIIGLERVLGVTAADTVQTSDANLISNLEQTLYDPPNVGSWKGYRNWINTNTYPLRIKYSGQLLNGASIANFIKKFDNYTDSTALLAGITKYLLPDFSMITTLRYSEMKQILLNGLEESAWTTQIQSDRTEAIEGVRNLIKEIIYSPDFQLY